jgi:GT2 family glycosyltransferase
MAGGMLKANTPMKPFVTIIVPSRIWTRDCDECLVKLRNQDYPQSDYEIIFVLDPPETSGVPSAYSVVSSPPKTSVVYSPTPGVSAARNHGISLSKGALLAFTDSDCRPCTDWLSKMVECQQKSRASIVTGPVVPDSEKVLPPIRSATTNEESSIPRAPTCNVVYLKSAIMQVGGFDTRFRSGEDTDLMIRVLEHDHNLVFCDGALVVHQIRETPVLSLWRASSGNEYHPLLFRLHRSWTIRYLRVKWRFTWQTMVSGSLLISLLLWLALSFAAGLTQTIVLPAAVFLLYLISYVRSLPVSGRRLDRILLGSAVMFVYSIFAFIRRVQGSIRYRTLLL